MRRGQEAGKAADEGENVGLTKLAGEYQTVRELTLLHPALLLGTDEDDSEYCEGRCAKQQHEEIGHALTFSFADSAPLDLATS
jgi:hypothetical protein